MPKPKKKKKRNRNKAGAEQATVEGAAGANQEADEVAESGMPAVAHTASQEALPDIFGGPEKGPGQIKDILSPNGNVENPDLEISDGEAPDVEEAKRNLRSQAEKKRKQKKTLVGGVT